jgi:WD40 repeat protein
MKVRRTLKGHQSKVLCSAWSSDKRHLATTAQDGKVIVWDAFASNKVLVGVWWQLSAGYAKMMDTCAGCRNVLSINVGCGLCIWPIISELHCNWVMDKVTDFDILNLNFLVFDLLYLMSISCSHLIDCLWSSMFYIDYINTTINK